MIAFPPTPVPIAQVPVGGASWTSLSIKLGNSSILGPVPKWHQLSLFSGSGYGLEYSLKVILLCGDIPELGLRESLKSGRGGPHYESQRYMKDIPGWYIPFVERLRAAACVFYLRKLLSVNFKASTLDYADLPVCRMVEARATSSSRRLEGSSPLTTKPECVSSACISGLTSSVYPPTYFRPDTNFTCFGIDYIGFIRSRRRTPIWSHSSTYEQWSLHTTSHFQDAALPKTSCPYQGLLWNRPR